ncbi:hypothetical protein CARUB_v10006318mg, partial [Capsella rubella]
LYNNGRCDSLIFAARVFVPLHRGVVRAMMLWFIHGVLPGISGLIDITTIIVNNVLMQNYSFRRIWDPIITSEAFIMKISNNIFGVRCIIIGCDCTHTMPNFMMCTMTPYGLIEVTGFFYVMWSFKQRMPIRHTYHIHVR